MRARPIERKCILAHLGIRAGLRALANSGTGTVQSSSVAHHEVGGLDAKRPKGLSFAVPHEKPPKYAFREQIVGVLMAFRHQVATCKVVASQALVTGDPGVVENSRRRGGMHM